MTRILVVDDEFTVRYAVRSVLEDAGYDVAVACDGEEALNTLASSPFDIVVIDIIMPRKEGMETTVQIRRDYPDIKVIAVSGGGKSRNVDILEKALSLGAHAILRKPFTDDQLLEIVSKGL